MPRYIDAEALSNFANNQVGGITANHIMRFPTADVEPVRHGRWIRGKNKSAFPAKPPAIWYCSCCGEMIRYNDSTGTYQKKKKKVNEVNPRCRRCGAKMDLDYQEGEP